MIFASVFPFTSDNSRTPLSAGTENFTAPFSLLSGKFQFEWILTVELSAHFFDLNLILICFFRPRSCSLPVQDHCNFSFSGPSAGSTYSAEISCVPAEETRIFHGCGSVSQWDRRLIERLSIFIKYYRSGQNILISSLRFQSQNISIFHISKSSPSLCIRPVFFPAFRFREMVPF